MPEAPQIGAMDMRKYDAIDLFDHITYVSIKEHEELLPGL